MERDITMISMPNGSKKQDKHLTLGYKKWQATYITPLQPYTLAAFPPWGILQELVV